MDTPPLLIADSVADAPLPMGARDLLDVLLGRLDTAVCLFDPLDRIVLWNPAYPRFFPEEADLLRPGVSYEDTLRRYFAANLPPEEMPALDRHLAAGLRRHREQQDPYVYQRRDGRWFRVEAHRFVDGSRLKIWTDVTAEKALVADRALGRDTAAAMRVGFARIGAGGAFVMANRALGDLLPDVVGLFHPGVAYTALLAAVAERLLAPGQRERLRPLIERTDPRSSPATEPATLERRDGGWLQFEERLAEDGDLYSLWTDVTVQVRSEQAARRARRQLSVAVESLPEGFALYDDDDRLVECNALYRSLMGPGCAAGAAFDEILAGALAAGHFPEAAALEPAERQRWCERIRIAHRLPGGPLELAVSGDRRIRIAERPTPDGGIVSVVRDVTAERRREGELAARSAAEIARKNAILEATLENMGQGIAMVDADLRVLAVNRRLSELYDVPPDLARPGMRFEDLIRITAERGEYGDGIDVEAEVRRRVAEARRADVPLYEHVRPNGRIVEVRTSLLPDGGFVRTYTDVTARRRAEEESARKADMLRIILENMSQGIALVDARDRIVAFNQRALDLLGLPAEMAAAAPSMRDVARFQVATGRIRLPDDAPDLGDDLDAKVDVLFATLTGNGRETGYVRRQADGRVLEVQVAPLPDGGHVRTFSDVTARKNAEAELALKTQTLEALLEHMDQGVIMYDADGRVVACNRRVRDLLELPDAVFAGGPTMEGILAHQIATGEFGPNLEQLPSLLRPGGRPARVNEHPPAIAYERRRPNGTVLEVRANLLPSGGLVRTYTDMTRRKRTEEELARKSALLQAVLESIGQGLCAFDGELRMIAWNQRFIDLLKFPAAFNVEGRPFADFMRHNAERGEYGPGDVEEQVRERVERARRPEPHRFERRLGDGTVIEVYGLPMAGGGFVSTFTDVSERKRVEEELRSAKERAERALGDLQRTQESLVQAEKLASLAQLVAGVAHEINTPVGVALTAISHLGEEVRKISAAFEEGRIRRSDFASFLALCGETAQMIMSNIDRASDLIQSFKQVAVDQASAERRTFNLRDYVQEVLLSLRPRFKKSAVTVASDIPADVVVDGFPGAFSQVLSNLLINALVHAYDEGEAGTIRLTAAEVEPGMVEMRYQDDGRGIAAANLARVFDPFFTTKRGRGASGLGLHIVYNIVTGTMRGSIAVASEEGKGTSFVLRFPRRVPVAEGGG
ncbi:PAS-domain containing protein [Azospirillum sp. ST 5-10]|uniref:PAS-domain containing protein n=1 Tax=unclassified Azospirillum TaxID=2630922 RepID=UPI003F49DEE1